MPTRHSDTLVRVIGGFKVFKASLLFALGIGGLTASGVDLSRLVNRALGWIGLFPGRQSVAHALHRLLSMDLRTEHRLAALSLVYAAVFLVEGVGLLIRKRWAEWVTVVVTTSFIPFEIYELFDGFGTGKLVALILNVIIAVYLLWRRIEDRRSLATRMRQTLSAA